MSIDADDRLDAALGGTENGRPAVIAPARDDVVYEIVSTDAALAAVGPAWMVLWRESDALVFQSHAWVAAWWASVPSRDRRRIMIVLARRGTTLVGVLPLAICRRKAVRVLEWAAKDYTDFADALLAPGEGAGLVQSMWQQISRAGGFDVVYLNRLLPDAAARVLLASAPGVRLRLNHRHDANWRVCGAGLSGEAWFEAKSKKTRQNYRRGQKAISAHGTLIFRRTGEDEPLDPLLARLATLKRAWLATKGLSRTTRFYDADSAALSAMVRVLADAGLLYAFVLECAGEVVAVSINFVQHGAMMAFVTTYDPAFERGSPGMVLMMDYIKWSFDRGLHTVDFLSGDESFKDRFGTECLTLGSMTGSRTLRGAAALLIDNGRMALRRRLASRRAPAAR